MQTRKPVVAGQFYPGQHDSCIAEIHKFLEAIAYNDSLPKTLVAGIVPHAGWTFSGALAARVFAAIKQRHEKINTFIIFGAAHGYFGDAPAVCPAGAWLTPLGEVVVDLLPGLQGSRDDAGHLRAGGDGGIRYGAHEADMPAAVGEGHPRGADRRADRAGRLDVDRVEPRRGSAEDRDCEP